MLRACCRYTSRWTVERRRLSPTSHAAQCDHVYAGAEVTLGHVPATAYLQQAREHEKPRGMADVNPADVFLQ